jgi:hypothetical protein
VTAWRHYGFAFINGNYYSYIDRLGQLFTYTTSNNYVAFAYGTWWTGIMKDLRVFSNGFENDPTFWSYIPFKLYVPFLTNPTEFLYLIHNIRFTGGQYYDD